MFSLRHNEEHNYDFITVEDFLGSEDWVTFRDKEFGIVSIAHPMSKHVALGLRDFINECFGGEDETKKNTD